MQPFCGLTVEELDAWFEAENLERFRLGQVLDWVYTKGCFLPQQMSNLSKALREKLSAHFTFQTLKLRTVQESDDDETYKFLWELSDGKLVESVLILSGARRTVCVSSQVGCPARCAFCASGKKGLVRQLTASEIVEQVVAIDAWLKPKGERVSHIVFMGMGEPLENPDTVIKAISLLTDPKMLGLSSRRITVSTVGVVEGIEQLAKSGLRVNLVLSLHAPNDHIRKKIIPYARKYPLERVLHAMDTYAKASKRDITYEYIVIEGINAEPEHAEELAKLVKDKQCTVNLIPYNPVPGLRLKRPSPEVVHAFRKVLEKRVVNTTWRYQKGDDIAAACGQLALQES